MIPLDPHRSYQEARRAAILGAEAQMEAWRHRPVMVAVPGGYAGIRPCDYAGLISTSAGVTLLTTQGRIETTESLERIQRAFTPPRVRPLVAMLPGLRYRNDSEYAPGYWVDE